ncbi:MFS transporter [Micromonospora sp. PLK6-60]|uniref:MFS transporter n=1 Tax=Micromonospora sp. PLK6-60 TaxID=2873383 RepID=UPI001CA63358|nr:MFS transporter [Micromonospora sp. PLK6-60]MBY8870743.1 MFS transporter [Micromonospora sp. PLK6-60]
MTTTSTPRAGRREWIGLAVLALPTLLLALDLSVLYLALPHLAADLEPDSTQLLWIMDIYGFMIAGFLITMGTLGDRIGRRRLLLIGAAAFGLASVAAAWSTSPEMLIATRALLGVAGATLMPSTLSLIRTMFADARQRSMAIAVWMTCFMVGTAIGPVVGGLLLELFWWGAVFLLGVPVMAVLLIAGPLLLPEYRAERAARLDPLSVLLSLATILPIVYGLKHVTAHGLGLPVLLAALVGLAAGTLFVRRQRRLADPLVDLRLFRAREFSAVLGVLLFASMTVGGIMLFATQYLQLVEERSPLRAGLWLLPHTGAMIVGSMLAPVLAQKIRPGLVVGAGLGISAVGYVLLTQVHADGGLALAVTGLVITWFGFAPAMVLGTDLVVGAAPAERAGSASALSETSTELSVALGIAVLGSVGTAVYRGRMDGVDLPAEATEPARDSLLGAVDAAARLPADVAASVLAPARDAFMAGFGAAAWVAAGIVAVLGVVAALLLRDVRPTGAAEAADAADAAAETDERAPQAARG